MVRRRLRIEEPIVEVFSNDARLASLHEWDDAAEAVSA